MIHVKVDDQAAMDMIRKLGIRAVKLPEEIVRELVATGEHLAKSLAGATSPELSGSITTLPTRVGATGVTGGFSTRQDFAPYVEYGTGLPGSKGEVKNGQERNPIANGFSYTLETMQYRFVKGIGLAIVQAPGWVYDDPIFGCFHTLGQPARPFMYPAVLKMQEQAAGAAAAKVENMMR